MPAEINTDAELWDYARGLGLGAIDDAALADANVKAIDRIRQAALNDYTSATFESLTASDAPPEMKDIHCYLAVGIYSSGFAKRPDTITDRWNEAMKYLGILAGGKTHYDESPDAVLVKRSNGGSRVKRISGQTSKTFDRPTDGCNAFTYRDEQI